MLGWLSCCCPVPLEEKLHSGFTQSSSDRHRMTPGPLAGQGWAGGSSSDVPWAPCPSLPTHTLSSRAACKEFHSFIPSCIAPNWGDLLFPFLSLPPRFDFKYNFFFLRGFSASQIHGGAWPLRAFAAQILWLWCWERTCGYREDRAAAIRLFLPTSCQRNQNNSLAPNKIKRRIQKPSFPPAVCLDPIP